MKTKIFYWLGCLLLTLMFTSCSDDDGVGSGENLVGTWEIIHDEGWERVDGVTNSEWDDYDNYLRLLFEEDKTFVMQEYYGNRWHKELYGTWSLKSGKLKLYSEDSEDEPEVYTVKTLNATTLIIEMSDKYKEDGETWEEFNRLTFTRISE
jgi:hypothetical protein